MYACIYGAYQGQEASQVVLVVKNIPMGDMRDPWSCEDPLEEAQQPPPVFLENPWAEGATKRTMIHRVTKELDRKEANQHIPKVSYHSMYQVYFQYTQNTYMQILNNICIEWKTYYRIQSRTEQQVPPQFIYLDLGILYVLRASPLVPEMIQKSEAKALGHLKQEFMADSLCMIINNFECFYNSVPFIYHSLCNISSLLSSHYSNFQ